jgi:N-acetylglucosaminyldiphosphoundecaprenol N-acetyl-beta-D-mannosaminyltransferase
LLYNMEEKRQIVEKTMQKKISMLGADIHNVTMQEALSAIDGFIKEDGLHQVITLNAEILYQAQTNERLLALINKADLVTPDGSGIVWGADYLGMPLKERVSGIDLLWEICRLAPEKGWRIYLLGAAPGIADKAAENLKNKYPGISIVGVRNGYFNINNEEEVRDILKDVQLAAADVIFIAMGAPRQEYFIEDYGADFGVKVAIGVGGSFDVVAGAVKRAPVFMQKMGIEWLWRLLCQPSRWKRMMNLPRFVRLVKKTKKKQRL